MNKIFALLLSLSWGITEAMAQDFSFVATVNKNSIALNENVQLTLRVSNASVNGRIILPPMSDFQVAGGPSTRNEFNSINGKMTVSYSETYVLRPIREGSLTIPEITVQTDKGKLASKPLSINVGKANAGPPQAQRQDPQSTGNAGDFWVEIQLNKRKVFVGEPVLASYVFYSAFDPLEYNDVKFPAPSGFWSESIDSENKTELQVINGRRYATQVVKRELLFPQVTGKLEISGFSVDMTVNAGGSFFFRKTGKVSDSATPVSVEVMPFPAGQPAALLGGYDGLRLDIKADRTEVKADEAINLSAVFSGNGNLKLLEALPYDFPPDFEVFEPRVKDNLRVSTSGVSGSRSFEYVLIPRAAGTYTLPALQLSYFDYESKSYKTLTSPELLITVTPGDGSDTGNYTIDNRTDVQLLRQDIRHIRTGEPALLAHNSRFYGSPLFYGAMALPALLFIGVLLRKRNRQREEEDVTGTRKKKAAGVAKKHLAAAASALKTADRNLFYQELSRALQSYLAGKFAITSSDLTRQRIKITVGALDPMLADDVLAVMEQCDQARFSPAADNRHAAEQLERAASCIEKLESLSAKMP
jgi:hypothetical protein